jgi:hypothetical protein
MIKVRKWKRQSSGSCSSGTFGGPCKNKGRMQARQLRKGTFEREEKKERGARAVNKIKEKYFQGT